MVKGFQIEGVIHKYDYNSLDNLPGVVTPEMFGAKGDGSTDDTTALQAAINSGKSVKLINHYKISQGLLLASNTVIDGEGLGKISKLSGNTKYSIFYAFDSAVNNVVIENLSLEGLKQWTGQSLSGRANDYGVRISNGSDIKIRNCSFKDFGGCAIGFSATNAFVSGNDISYTGTFTGSPPNYNFGIEYSGTNVTIENNHISGVIHGIICGLTNENVVIRNNNISTNGQHGMYMESGNKVVVQGNVFHDCTLCGVKFQLSDSNITVFKNIVIDGNSFSNCLSQGILLVKISGSIRPTDVIISNNVIDLAHRGIEISDFDNVIVIGNKINVNFAEGYGVFVKQSSELKISGNHISCEDAPGIYFANDTTGTYFKQVTVSQNTIKRLNSLASGNKNAIRINAMVNGIIDGNVMIGEGDKMTGTDGLFLDIGAATCDRLYIVGNISYGFRWDIRALSSGAGCTARNNIVGTITGISQE